MAGFDMIATNRDYFNGLFDPKKGVNAPIQNAYGQSEHPLSEFFGQGQGKKGPNDGSIYDNLEYNRNEQLPYALVGKNTYLATLTYGLIDRSDDWTLNEPDGCPMQQVDSLHYSMTRIIFEEGVMDAIPEEGPGRIMRHTKVGSSGTLIRKGKALLLEHGFAMHPEGRMMYYRQLQQIACTAQNDCSLHTIQAMFNCRMESVKWAQEKGFYDKPYRELIAEKYYNFAAFQKNADAPALILDKMKEVFRLRGVEATMIVVAQGGEHFFHGVAPEKTNFHDNGPAGIARANASPYNTTTCRQLRMRFTRPYLSPEVGQIPYDPTVRHRVVGDYFKMFAPSLSSIGNEDYKSSWRTVYLMDFAKDTWAPLTLKMAIENCHIFNEDGFLNDSGYKDANARSVNKLARLPENHVTTRIMNNRANKPTGEQLDLDVFGLVGPQAYRRGARDPNLGPVAGVIQVLGQSALSHIPHSVIDYMAKQIVRGGHMDQLNAYTRLSSGTRVELDTKVNLLHAGDPIPEDVNALIASAGVSGAVPSRTIGSDLSSRKRSLADADGGSDARIFGVFTYPDTKSASATVSASTAPALAEIDIKAMHQENLDLLKSSSVPEEAKVHYEEFLSKDALGGNAEGFIRRSNQTLQLKEADKTMNDLLNPLIALSTKAVGQKRVAATIAALVTPLVSASSSLATSSSSSSDSPSRLQSNASFYKHSDIQRALGAKGVNFHPLDLDTGAPITDAEKVEAFDPHSFDGISAAMRVSNIGIDERAYVRHKSKFTVPAAATLNLNVPLAADPALVDVMNALKARLTSTEFVSSRAPGDVFYERIANARRQHKDGANPSNSLSNDLFNATVLLLMSEITLGFMLFLERNNIYFPWNFLIQRPFGSFITSSAIMGRGGRETGTNMTYGQDFMLGDDPVTKMHTGFYTMYHACVITCPINLMVLDDLFIRKYTGGFNMIPFTKLNIDTMTRRNWAPPPSMDRPSWWATIVALSCTDVDPIIDARGYFEEQKNQIEKSPRLLHFVGTSCDYVLQKLRNGSALPNPHPYDHVERRHNTVVAQATQRCWSISDKKFTAYILGTVSALGVNVYPGCKAVLEHRERIFKDCGYEKMEQYEYN